MKIQVMNESLQAAFGGWKMAAESLSTAIFYPSARSVTIEGYFAGVTV
jgi:hypothetical protein